MSAAFRLANVRVAIFIAAAVIVAIFPTTVCVMLLLAATVSGSIVAVHSAAVHLLHARVSVAAVVLAVILAAAPGENGGEGGSRAGVLKADGCLLPPFRTVSTVYITKRVLGKEQQRKL